MTYLDIFQSAPWWLWVVNIALYPVYQVLGTLKHEGAHALAAKAQGLNVLDFRFLPFREGGSWYWGYTRFDGQPNKTTILAPYYADALVFIVGVVLFFEVKEEWWSAHISLFFPCFILMLILPLIDVLYNLGKWMIKDRGDFADAFGDI